MSNPSLASPPPTQTYALLSFPSPDILLVTFNRPQSLNCVNVASSWELHALFTWFDNEPSLRVAIVTGFGRAFCAGADLKGRFIVYFLELVYVCSIGNDCRDPKPYLLTTVIANKVLLGYRMGQVQPVRCEKRKAAVRVWCPITQDRKEGKSIIR
jgi:hypothetical protein